MTTVEHDGTKATFEDVEDAQLSAAYHRYNKWILDDSLPSDAKVRWAKLIDPDGFQSINGWLFNYDPPATPYLFVDSRLRVLYPCSGHLVDLVLLHEMCHFRVPQHDAAFVRELLTALERVSWEPLVAKCVPVSLHELMSKQSEQSTVQEYTTAVRPISS